jgi:hypothetical protein
MAKMSIELYRGVLKRARQLLAEHQNFTNGTTENGLKLPMMFYDDIQKQRSEINRHIGELDAVIKTLPKDSSEEYRNVLQELMQVDIQLKEMERSFL